MRRLLRTSILSAGVIVGFPFAAALLVRHSVNDKELRILPSADAMADSGSRSNGPAVLLAEYQARRRPVIDRLLPEGVGGTHFFEHIDSAGGIALWGNASIEMRVPLNVDFGEAVEIHERAHLFSFAHHAQVERVLATTRAPEPDEYAAKNGSEHFAEMAARAWEIVMPSHEICYDGSPAVRLHESEHRVPGTAGFVVWFLRERDVPGDTAGTSMRDELRNEVLPLAEQMIAHNRAEWEVLYSALEARRRADGTFTPWPAPSLREMMERMYARDPQDGLARRLTRPLFLPSLWVVRVVGR